MPLIEIRKVWATACKKASLALAEDSFTTSDAQRLETWFGPESMKECNEDFRHKTRSVFDRYNIVSEDDLKEAVCLTWELAQGQKKNCTIVPLRSNQ
jgi:hypothetical protein